MLAKLVFAAVTSLGLVAAVNPNRANGTANEQPSARMNFEEFQRAGICSHAAARICFDDMDVNKDGFVTNEEMDDYYRRQQIIGQELNKNRTDINFRIADANGDGKVSRSEMAAFADKMLMIRVDRAFDEFFNTNDQNGDGFLQPEEFSRFFNTWFSSDVPLKPNFVPAEDAAN